VEGFRLVHPAGPQPSQPVGKLQNRTDTWSIGR